MKKFIFTLILFLSLSVSGLCLESDINKLDPILRPLLDSSGIMRAPSSVIQSRDANFPQAMINTIIKVSGNPSSLRGIGVNIRTIAGDFITADAPVSSLPGLIAMPNVIRIQSARKMEICREMETMLDVSVPDTGADQVWNGTPGYTGKDVLVAIIDTGIDWDHPAFMGADGKTRILYIWDQTIHNFSRLPVGFMYGTEWTKADIDAGICKEIDEHSHGTHVSSTVAGDERKYSDFTGMAPEANLIIIKSDFYDSDVIDAVRYIFNKADILQKPVVINMSFGSNWGPHDGTEFLDQALDELIDRSGRAIVASAGNSGGRNIHLGAISLRKSSSGDYSWTAIKPLIGAEFIPMEIWYAPSDSLSVRLLLPRNTNGDLDNFNSGWVHKGESLRFIIPEGPLKGAEAILDATLLASDDYYPNFNNIYIHLSNNGNLNIPVDDYTFAVEFDGDGFDAYLPHYGIFTTDIPASADFPSKPYLMAGDGNYSIISPSSASKIISVASYVSKSEWIDLENRLRDDSLKIDTISAFSSRGPLLNGVFKPELAAPGQMVVAAFSSDSWDRARFIYRDKMHASWNGTSMSSPHVAGAIALMFQQNPDLDTSEIRNKLISSATDMDPDGWDRAWGYGKLNVLKAMDIPSTPKGVNVIISGESIKISWRPNKENDIAGYKIYNSSGDSIDVGNVTSYTLAEPDGANMTLSLSAYNSSGNESPKTGEITIKLDQIAPKKPAGLNVTSINEALLLKWTANSEYNISGYEIHYGNSSRNYDKIIRIGNRTEYLLEKLTNGRRIYIAITAIDKAGNESEKSDEVSAVPQLFHVSEFRYQRGFPKNFGQDIYSSPAIYDVDGDGKIEIAIATRDGKIALLRFDGSYMTGFPVSTNKNTTSSPVICDLDGNGQAEIIAASGNEIYVWHNNGKTAIGWPQTINDDIVASPAVGDLNNDGEPEIVIGSLDGNIYVFRKDGAVLDGFPFLTGGSIYSSAAIGDVDGDLNAEIIIGSDDDRLYLINSQGILLDGWSVRLDGDIRSSPAICDLDSNGKAEIIANTKNGSVYVFNANGSIASGWPLRLMKTVVSSPSIGDMDNDELSLEIVICTKGGLVYVLKNDGNILDGFPVPIIDTISSSPSLVDINSDGKTEIIVCGTTGLGYNGLVYALNRFGKRLDSRWPIAVNGNIIYSSPAITDLDGDGDIEICVGSCRYWDGSGGQLHVWDLTDKFDKDITSWNQFRQNACHTGILGSGTLPSGIDGYEDSGKNTVGSKRDGMSKTFALYQNYPNPFNPGTWIPYELAETNYVFIEIYALNGKLVRKLDLGMRPAGSYIDKKVAAYWNGKDDSGLEVSSGIFFCVLKSGGFKMVRKMILIR